MSSTHPRDEGGQALLIVLLVMAVALTVGLSLATRAAVNIRIATEDERSQRAFSAAEAGVEETLRTCTTGLCTPAQPPAGGFTANKTTFEVTVNQVSGRELVFSNAPQDEGVHVWLSSFGASTGSFSGDLTLYWGQVGDCPSVAALELIVISGSKTSPTLSRYAFDSCSRSNEFQIVPDSAGTVRGVSFRTKTTISVTSGLLMRVRPLYESSSIGVVSSTDLPGQGYEITSVGKTCTPAEGICVAEQNPVTRKIRVFNSYPSLPSALSNYTLFSGGGSGLSQ